MDDQRQDKVIRGDEERLQDELQRLKRRLQRVAVTTKNAQGLLELAGKHEVAQAVRLTYPHQDTRGLDSLGPLLSKMMGMVDGVIKARAVSAADKLRQRELRRLSDELANEARLPVNVERARQQRPRVDEVADSYHKLEVKPQACDVHPATTSLLPTKYIGQSSPNSTTSSDSLEKRAGDCQRLADAMVARSTHSSVLDLAMLCTLLASVTLDVNKSHTFAVSGKSRGPLPEYYTKLLPAAVNVAREAFVQVTMSLKLVQPVLRLHEAMKAFTRPELRCIFAGLQQELQIAINNFRV